MINKIKNLFRKKEESFSGIVITQDPSGNIVKETLVDGVLHGEMEIFNKETGFRYRCDFENGRRRTIQLVEEY